MRHTSDALPVPDRRRATGGFVLLGLYFLILPLLSGRVYDLLWAATGREPSLATFNLLYYLVLLLLCVPVFRPFWGESLRNRPRSFSGWAIPIFGGYLMNWFLSLIATGILLFTIGMPQNLNNEAMELLAGESRGVYLLMALVLAPIVEESLFRGLLFGTIRKRSRSLAYTAGILLFALLHVWQYAADLGDPTYLVLMFQYLGAGAALCWSYEKGGSLAVPVGLHCLINLIAVIASGV